MTLHDVALSDRFDLAKRAVLLGGIPALVRALLMQKARDEAAGLVTAGYATGYRGSPLGGVDQAMWKAGKQLAAADVKFEPGLNEDLAATALWGTQQAELRGEGRVQGVFGLWYGKGPGVDRCGDVFRHANMAGTSAHGGVVACLGDDHTGESSTVLHHSEFALVDAMMPILSPAGVQEVLDYALLGWALSRYAGTWVGLKCVKDTIEVTEVVDGDPHRLKIVTPTDFAMPEGGLNIRLHDTPVAQEARLHDHKRFAAEAFARANRIDRRVRGDGDARIGIVSCGKSWLDTSHALDLLGLDDAECRRLGIATYKVGMVWPLDMESFRAWAHDLEHIIVVEEKRKLVEVQIKEAIFDDRRGRRVTGWKDEQGNTIFTVKQALDPVKVARTLGTLLSLDGIETERLAAARARLDEAVRADNAEEIAVRKPWFCSGCPHNTSTRLPEGARAYAGIGCHYMVQWMDRATEGFTHMGGEGANWIGEAPFSKRPHVFQNLGDGTYNHSGSLAIRAALAAGVNITYKILYNDAVAMTGGQPNEGGLTAPQIARELQAMGVKTIVGVYDEKEDLDLRAFPIPMRPRGELDTVQREMEKVDGRLRHPLRPDLRRREAPPPQARHLPRPRPARLHQPRRLRGLRRLRHPVELRLDRPARDRVRPQARHRPVVVQQGLLLPRTASARASSPSRAPRSARPSAPRSTCRRSPSRRSRRSTAPTTSSSPASAAPASSPSARSSPWPPTSRARAPARWRWPASPRRAAPSTSTSASPTSPPTSPPSASPSARPTR